MSYIGGNTEVKSDPIWILAKRNNEKQAKFTYRVNGVKVRKSEFQMAKKK